LGGNGVGTALFLLSCLDPGRPSGELFCKAYLNGSIPRTSFPSGLGKLPRTCAPSSPCGGPGRRPAAGSNMARAFPDKCARRRPPSMPPQSNVGPLGDSTCQHDPGVELIYQSPLAARSRLHIRAGQNLTSICATGVKGSARRTHHVLRVSRSDQTRWGKRFPALHDRRGPGDSLEGRIAILSYSWRRRGS